MVDIVKKISTLCIIILLFGGRSNAQIGKYLVIFKDKANNTHSIANPLTFVNQRSIDRRAAQGIPFLEYDLPPTQSYVDGLAAAGATVWYTSRWLNAALVLMTPTQATNVLALPYVKGFENNGPMDLKANGQPGARVSNKFEIQLENLNHGNATNQTNMLGLQHLHNASFKGEGKIIALLDDGYNSINLDTYLATLFSENRVVDKYDFVRNQAEVYDVGGHGNLVLSTIAANVPGSFVGTAPQAKYALFRTEYAPDERIIEEANYLFGCERADAIGSDIINSSLGYSTYDYSAYNHIGADYNGDKTLVTRAADWAARAGMLVCTSQGNSGSAGIAAPADADSVMSVGGVKFDEIYWGSSSVGPTADNRTKPDVAAKGQSATLSRYNTGTMTSQLVTGSGTSFASPIMAGFVACYWQANPEMNNMQVLNAIRNIGNQAAMPDNLLGWGIPKYPNLTNGINQDSRTKTIQLGIQNTFLTADNQRFIAQVLPVAPNEISGSVFAKVIVDATTQTVNGMPTLIRHFEITPATNATTAKAKVTFFANQAEFNTYNSNNPIFLDLPAIDTDEAAKANLRILQYHQLPDNSFEYKLLNPVDTDIKWNTTEDLWEISVEVTGFSDFYITSLSETVLPVNLIQFSGSFTSNGNLLSWITANELDANRFEIQRSFDLKVITNIGTVLSLGNSNTNLNYDFYDDKDLISGPIYYRLKIIDNDGTSYYSKFISIVTLPVSLVSFKIVNNQNRNKLEWITAFEKNHSHFEIEKSNNGSEFLQLGFVKGGEFSKETKHYEFVDMLNVSEELTYYRLKMVDLDGKFEYSKIVSIKNETDFEMKIIENPISDELAIQFGNKIKGEINVQIFDLLGKNIFAKQMNVQSNQLKINVINWNNGEYILNISSQDYKILKKFLKR
jgi:serine protease AprX